MSEWFDNEELWKTFGPCMFTEEQFATAAEQIPVLVQMAGIRIARVLDLGCGPGRHAVALAEHGLAVTGVDLSQHLLDLARERAEKRGVEVDWQRADMRQFSAPEQYDLILNLWSSFGYFEDLADDRKVLDRCLENLVPGGVLILDVVGKEYVLQHMEPVHLTEFDDGRLLIERPTLEGEMTRYENEWLLIDGERVHRTQWGHNLYSGAEMRRLLADAGFTGIDLYGDWNGAPYDMEAERLIAVARKPET